MLTTLVVISDKLEETQQLLTGSEEMSTRVCLRISFRKSKFMMNLVTTIHIRTANNKIERAYEYKYIET